MSPIPLTQAEATIADVVERVGPAVVTISTVQMARDQTNHCDAVPQRS